MIELNHETVTRLRAQGIRALYGDASQQEILERAGIREAASLVFAASGSAEEVIRIARTLNPDLLTLVRANYLSDVPALERAGAHVVVAAEGEVALAMTERLMTQLGATSDQLDRARDRVRQAIGKTASASSSVDARASAPEAQSA